MSQTPTIQFTTSLDVAIFKEYAIPEAAKMLGCPQDQIVIVGDMAMGTGHMYGKHRDHMIKRTGLWPQVPPIIHSRAHKATTVATTGMSLYHCHGEPDMKYAVLSYKLPNEEYSQNFHFVRKGSIFRTKRHHRRMAKLATCENEPPILADGILTDIINNTIGFLKNQKAMRRYKIQINRGILLDGPPGNGKAQPLDSLVYTPHGPVNMGDIHKGDWVSTPDGGKAEVVGVFPQGKKPVVRITFDNGDQVECCEDHLWEVAYKGAKPRVRDTAYLKKYFRTKGGYSPLRIRVSSPVCFNDRKVEIDPYMMGVLLGDGALTQKGLKFSSVDEEIVCGVTASVAGHGLEVRGIKDSCDWSVTRGDDGHRYNPNEITVALRGYGLDKKLSTDKFIPNDYLYNSEAVRWSLLQGLMDTDGGVEGSEYDQGQNVFYTSSPKLAEGVKSLVQSLGGLVRTTIKERPTYRYLGELKVGQPAYRLCVQFDDPSKLFRLSRKGDITRPRTHYKVTHIVRNVEEIGEKECQCILIDHPQHLYLTDNFVPTHNTMVCRYIERLCWDNNISFGCVTSSEIDEAYRKNTLSHLFAQYQITVFDDIDIGYLNRRHGDGKMACSLLTAMDGMARSKTFLIRLFTTNEKIENLDEAFTRPGRIDRCITLDRPKLALRLRLIERWPREINDYIDTAYLAGQSRDFSYADLEAVRCFLVMNYLLGTKTWDVDLALETFNKRKEERKAMISIGFAAEIAKGAEAKDDQAPKPKEEKVEKAAKKGAHQL